MVIKAFVNGNLAPAAPPRHEVASVGGPPWIHFGAQPCGTRLWIKSTISCVEVPGRKISAMPDFFKPEMSASGMMPPTRTVTRSEEHTSELQSQSNLVCRLLLEKKNNSTC